MAAQAVYRILDAYGTNSRGIALMALPDIVFDEYDVVQPDVLFFRTERRHMVQPDAVTRERPDIAVEVLSPSTVATDRGKKMQMFARYGVPEYWILDPVIEQLEVHVPDHKTYRREQVALADDTVQSVLLPDLTFDAAGIFTVQQPPQVQGGTATVAACTGSRHLLAQVRDAPRDAETQQDQRQTAADLPEGRGEEHAMVAFGIDRRDEFQRGELHTTNDVANLRRDRVCERPQPEHGAKQQAEQQPERRPLIPGK